MCKQYAINDNGASVNTGSITLLTSLCKVTYLFFAGLFSRTFERIWMDSDVGQPVGVSVVCAVTSRDIRDISALPMY
jgi:hypothetical protein